MFSFFFKLARPGVKVGEEAGWFSLVTIIFALCASFLLEVTFSQIIQLPSMKIIIMAFNGVAFYLDLKPGECVASK